MSSDTINFEVPTFSNTKSESLDILEIMKNKKIVSVTIAYLSKEKKVKASGFKGLFGGTETKQDEKEIQIFDLQGITLSFTEGIESASIRFWDKNEFEKLSNGDYDEDTLWKRYVMTIIHPYQINFHIGNLINVDWD